MNDLFLHLNISNFSFSAYTVFNIIATLLILLFSILVIKKNSHILTRPASIISFLYIIIFQVPFSFFSFVFEKHISFAWFFCLAVHAIPLILLSWITLTPKLSERSSLSDTKEGKTRSILTFWSKIFLITLYLLFAGYYLSTIGLNCTGLFALTVDPEMMLLARELTGKLASSPASALAFGILVNVLCPILTLVSFHEIAGLISKKRFLVAFVWIIFAFILLLTVLLPGAKGALIPTFIVAGIYILYTTRQFFRICLKIFLLGSTAWILMIGIETIKDQHLITSKYDFVKCTARLHACDDAEKLLDSLYSRELSLGISTDRLAKLHEELHCFCSKTPKEQCANSFLSDIRKSKLSQSMAKATPLPSSIPLLILAYAEGIAYRAFVIPIQVASWHFLYVAEYGSPGKYAVPFFRKFFKKTISVPHLVNQLYGSKYSSGAVVSTGTAPTSFLLAYPAYWGLLGLIGAILCVIIFDLTCVFILGRLPIYIKGIGISLIAVISINFMLSDFFTTLSSHGGAAAIIILFALAYIEKRNS